MSIDTNFVRVKGIVRDDPTLSEVDGIGTVAKFRVGVYRSGSKKNDNIKYETENCKNNKRRSRK